MDPEHRREAIVHLLGILFQRGYIEEFAAFCRLVGLSERAIADLASIGAAFLKVTPAT